MKNEKGELIGLVLEPENGDNISSDNIKKIIPHIKNESFIKNMNNIQICDGLISFNNQINDIEKSIKIFKEMYISNNLINTKIIDLRVNNQIILTNKNE